MDYIEPELREDRGELEAAREHRLPSVTGRTRLGDLHSHTMLSDGRDTLEQMAGARRSAVTSISP